MACGIAPVVMDVGANAEILGPELGAQVVPAGDIDGFTRAVADTLRSEVRAAAARRVVRQRAQGRYSLDRLVKEYEGLYRRGEPAAIAPAPVA